VLTISVNTEDLTVAQLRLIMSSMINGLNVDPDKVMVQTEYSNRISFQIDVPLNTHEPF
jgi:hypothetical protein